MKKRLVSILTAIVLIISICFGNSSAETLNKNNTERHELSTGVQNIVKRAYQMTDIQWTPIKDIPGWNNEMTYKAGVTYSGLPYGQPVYASYVPWSTSLKGFVDAVNDPNSKMYTDRSEYEANAPYYSCDCSAFVSWAWGLSSRHTTLELDRYATKISDSSFKNAEVGDCLCLAKAHVVLITDITYDANDNISGIEISESTVNPATDYCCQKTWYGDGYEHSLSELSSKYFGAGYTLYRCNTRDSVTYAHSCASPLEGDVCVLCGFGTYKQTPVYAAVTVNEDTVLCGIPDDGAERIGTLYAGVRQLIDAYALDKDNTVWYRCEDGYWFRASAASVEHYIKSAAIGDRSFPSGALPSGKAFPVKGMITAKNEITEINAAIYAGGSASGKPVQEHSVPLNNTYSYSLSGSEIDYAMVFNDLSGGDYTFVLSVTERAYSPSGLPAEELITTMTSAFSIGNGSISEKTIYSGVDVSHHQDVVDWDTAAKHIDFAIIRCGYGDDLTNQDDRQWQNNVAACERLGIPYGVYLYSYALTDEQALSEARHALRLLKGHSPSLPVYLDLEDDSIEGLSNDDILRHTKIFCNALCAAGYETGVYANYYWWTTKLTSPDYDSWSRWIAVWNVSDPGYGKSYDIWQYSDRGSVPGIPGYADMDYLYVEAPVEVCHHEKYETQTMTAASCTGSGLIKHICTDCGYYYTETTAPLGHAYVSNTVEPSCQHSGYTSHVCSRCGASYSDNITEKTEHLFENGRCTGCGCTETVSGDLNGDGDITSADSVLLARYLAALEMLTDEQLLAADVNGDGDVTSADAVMLARFLAGLVTDFPVSE